MSENTKDLPVWGKILIAFITVGGIGSLTGFIQFNFNREDNYIEKYVQCKDEKIELISEFSIKELTYQSSIQNINNQLLTLKLITDIPFIFWVKNLDSEIIYISDEYENQLLKPLRLTKTDILKTKGDKLFTELELKEILRNDSIVLEKNLSNNQIISFKECVNSSEGISYKYLIKDNSNTPILLGGLFIKN